MSLLRWWEWLILVVTLVVVLGLLWAYFGAPNIENYLHQNSHLKQVDIKTFFEKADNGDLILLAGDTRGERSCRWATRSIFSHVGMLFREKHPQTGENLLYIWEADIGQGSRTGPRVMRVKDKLQRYKGFKILGWRALQGPRPSRKKILEVVENHATKALDSRMWPWILSFSSTLSRWSKDPKKVFCSELLALTLQDLGMMDSAREAYWYSPQDFHQTLLLGLRYPYQYSETVFVRFESTQGVPRDLESQ